MHGSQTRKGLKMLSRFWTYDDFGKNNGKLDRVKSKWGGSGFCC